MFREEKFYNYLKKKRLFCGLSQARLAQKTNVATSTICHIEAGSYTRFPLGKVLLLARNLNEDPEKFAVLWIDAILEDKREHLMRKIFDEGV